MLVAAENAGSWAGPIRVIGKADVAGAQTVREAGGACIVAGDGTNEAIVSRCTSDVAVGVNGSDLMPLSIEPAEAKVYEGPAGTTVKVPLKLNWRAEGSGKFKLKAGGSAPLDNFTEVEINAKTATYDLSLDLNKHKLPPGTHTAYVRVEGKVKYARNPELLKGAEEAKGGAEKAAADAAAALKTATEKLATAKAAADAEATKAAEKAAADADAAAKAAEAKKAEAVKRVADLGPKDVEGTFYSGPIQVKVTPPAEKK